jgi:hypothetical protein
LRKAKVEEEMRKRNRILENQKILKPARNLSNETQVHLFLPKFQKTKRFWNQKEIDQLHKCLKAVQVCSDSKEGGEEISQYSM